MPSSLNGTGVTFNDATTLQSGNIPAANLGSGTANSSVFLRGDKVWATVPASAPSTTDVLNATAGASVGAVGTYAFLSVTDNTTYSAGSTVAGSSLRYTGALRSYFAASTNSLSAGVSGTPSGTWRIMGHRSASSDPAVTTAPQQIAGLWLRIS